MSYTQPSPVPTTATVIGLSFELKSPRERVWRAITEEIALWWPRELHAGGADSKMTLDLRLGGHLSEQWGRGAGLLWYTVLAIEPGTSLDLVGHVTAKFGGPAMSQLSLRLEEQPGGTRISIQDGVVGPQRPEISQRIAEGWSLAFGNSLKRYLESSNQA